MAFIPFPAGTVLAYAGATAPSGWLMCDGTAYSRTEYADAYAAIGVLYGAGNGSTTFNVPDLRGVFMRGSGTNGTSNYGGVTGHTPAGGNLATKGGQKTAKNGLTATSTAPTFNGGSITGGTTGAASGDLFVNSANYPNYANTSFAAGGYTSGDNFYNARSHTHGVSGTSAGSNTSPTITVGTGDAETAPAALAVNYIIKI